MALSDVIANALPKGTGKEPWPPPHLDPVAQRMRVWSAFYGGDPETLSETFEDLGGDSPTAKSFFGTTGEQSSGFAGQARGTLLGTRHRWFWGQLTPAGEKRTKIHVPAAGDISQTSADLLFSRAPVITGSAANQAALDKLADDGLHSTLLEAAELCSALGGVYLRTVWDSDIADHAWIDMVPADAAIPHFVHGKLVAVTFWRVIYDSGADVVRHLETHIPSQGAILHQVFAGDQEKLGKVRALTDFPETAPYAEYLNDGDAITFPEQPNGASTVVYIPNMRPNRVWRALGPGLAPLGRSDFSGAESLMDSLDETMTSWQRDVQLAKMRLIVPASYLQATERGKGAIFEPDQSVFVPVNNMNPGAGDMQITANQFVIRWAEHQQTANDLLGRIISAAGFSGQTFGVYDSTGAAMTATEVEARERKSLVTRDKKILYWRPGLRDILFGWLAVQSQMFGQPVSPERPEIDFTPTVLPNQLELAQTAQALAAAEAASKETLVRLVHPDWTDADVKAEVQRIYAEIGSELFARAKLSLTAPPGEAISDQIGEIAEAQIPPPIPPDLPGEDDQGGT